jgi:hypothetical protein
VVDMWKERADGYKQEKGRKDGWMKGKLRKEKDRCVAERKNKREE